MTARNRWTLTMMASRDDGTLLLFRPVAGVHAHVRELLDSDMALLEFTAVVPRSQVEELQAALALDKSTEPEENRWLFVSSD